MLSQFKFNSISKYHFLLLIVSFTKLFAQEMNSQYSLVLTPHINNQWWSKYNNYGQESSKIYLNYMNNYKKKKKEFRINIFASKDEIYIGESFLQSKLFSNTYIKFGKYYRDFSTYLNDDLSSGSMLVSKNAEPMPKIGLLSSHSFDKNRNINFGISHALFDKSNFYISPPMLHEKFIYLNFDYNQTHFSIGLIHEAMWGGSTKKYGEFPNSFKDFLKVFIAADGPLLDGEPHANSLGNHLGVWDFQYRKTTDSKILKLYYQHFFEDTSGLRFANRFDGLWGIELSNYIYNTNLLIEYIDTTNQNRDPPYVNDYYYSNYQYDSGWTYKGYVLGNPFIDAIKNNPSKVIHAGISSIHLKDYNYKVLLSRKIHTSDFIKYHVVLSKVVDKYLVDIIFSGEKNKKNNMGIKVSYNL